MSTSHYTHKQSEKAAAGSQQDRESASIEPENQARLMTRAVENFSGTAVRMAVRSGYKPHQCPVSHARHEESIELDKRLIEVSYQYVARKSALNSKNASKLAPSPVLQEVDIQTLAIFCFFFFKKITHTGDIEALDQCG